MTNRKTQRVNGVLLALIGAGYSPKFKPSDDSEQTDDDIQITDNVSIQVDSRSGDAIAVNHFEGEGADVVMRSWDIDTDSKPALLELVKKVIDGTA